MTNIPRKKLRIAIAQTNSKDGDIPYNSINAIKLIQQAADNDATLIVFPEKYLTGYVYEIMEVNPNQCMLKMNDSRLENIREACKDNNIIAIIGGPINNDVDNFILTIVINNKGKEECIYNKTHLFCSENRLFKSDDAQCMLIIDDWHIGLGICYDAAFPEHARLLAKAGCHVYLVSSLYSVGNGYTESRIWFPARSLDNTIFTVMCNHIGKTGKWNACGSSAVWNPSGQVIAEASNKSPELLLCDLDPTDLIATRGNETI